MMVQLAGVVNDSIVDGPGIRLAVFFQGCPHHCPGCHNPDTHDPFGGKPWNTGDVLAMAFKNPLLDGITLTGGEPFLQPKAMAVLSKGAKEKGLSVFAYTGFIYEALVSKPDCLEALRYIDFLVDGPFEEGKRSIALRFKGSTNQRLIDVKKSLESKAAVTANI